MKKHIKKLLCSILIALMVLTSVPFIGSTDLTPLASAYEAPTKGMCGDNVSYSYNEKKAELTLGGTGKMWDYSKRGDEVTPFYTYWIKSLVIGSGVTYVDLFNLLQEISCLSKITVNKNNKYYSSDSSGVLFNKDKTELLLYPASSESTSYKIPSGVKKIADRAFACSFSLKSITIPNTVESIGECAFYCCSFTSVKIPSGVKTIGKDAFDGCHDLKKITVDKNNKYFSYDSTGVLFNKSKTKLILYPVGNTAKSYTVPSTVKTIGNKAFCDAANLESVTLSKNLTQIGYSAFAGCSKLKSISLPDTTTAIGSGCFLGCMSLKSVKLGTGLTTIGTEAFRGSDITSIKIPAKVNSIGKYAFKDCNSLKKISVDNNNAKYSCDSNGVLFNKNKTTLISYPRANTNTSYTIPNTVKTIYLYAFENCNKLSSIKLGNSVKTIGSSAFSGCYGLNSVVIPDSVTTIGSFAFWGCKNLNSLKLGKKLATIGNSAFGYCNALKSVYIPASVTSIGSGAFDYCKVLEKISVDKNNSAYSCDSYGILFNKDKSVLIKCPLANKTTAYSVPDTVTTIEDSAFMNCSSLKKVTIGTGVKAIGGSAFYGCVSLGDIDIKGNLNSVGRRAFFDTKYYDDEKNWDKKVLYLGNSLIKAREDISSFTMREGTTCIANDAFGFCGNLKEITIVDSVININSFAFDCCYNLERVNIGKGVKYIGERVFLDCLSLKDIYYSGTEQQWEKISISSDNADLFAANIHFHTHTFDGSVCTSCGFNKADSCTCNCHKTGIIKVIFTITNLFQKLFGQNTVCACGMKH